LTQLYIIELPEPPTVTLSGNCLCFNESYEGQLQVTMYTVEIKDNTGFQYNFEQDKYGPYVCMDLSQSSMMPFLNICGPWSIKVRSLNDIGYSNYNNIVLGK